MLRYLRNQKSDRTVKEMLRQLSIILTLTLSSGITQPVIAQTPSQSEPPTEQKTLKVGVLGAPPFVIDHLEKPEGISVEIWRQIALRSQFEYQLIFIEKVNTGIELISQGQLDVLVGSISITADRLKTVDFTQPYFQAQIGLLVSSENPTLWSRVQPLFRIAIISSIGFFFFAIFMVGNLIWLAEHRRNEKQFPKAYIPGISNGMWFALVTLTTVGYGDKAPITKTGKIITSVWMIITAVAASSLTAGIASALTIFLAGNTSPRFNDPSSIQNNRIAVVEGTTGQDWAITYQARVIKKNNLEEAINEVLENRAEGVIFDAPALEYYLAQNPELPLKISNLTFASENYGFVLPIDSPLVQNININLLSLTEEGTLNRIYRESLEKLEEVK